MEIKKIKYRTHSVSVELDCGESLEFPLELMSLYNLKAGRQLGDEEYRQLRDESNRFRAKTKALNYLAIRMRSCAEMERYLTRKGFDAEVINEVVNSVREAGYLDDNQFARAYIKERLQKKVLGRDRVVSDLYRRGLQRKVIQRAMADTELFSVDMDAVLAAAEKKYNSLKEKDRDKWKAKVSSFLRSRGFDFELIKKIIRMMDERLQG